MFVLGIESSCDESALALLEFSGAKARILHEEISSQVDLHAQYGGVVPELASREHLRNLPLLYDRALKASGLGLDRFDLLAVTRGPGLKGCLLVGLGFARGLALASGKRLIGVNHIEGHILSAMLDHPDLEFPFLSLVVSGGHSEIVKVSGAGQYQVLARTIDDAAGEAFDKSASLLGFPYPGGAALAKLADTVESSEIRLPRVMREAPGFSFSGLKTAIGLKVSQLRERLESEEGLKASLAFAVQEAIVDTLIHKLKIALRETGIRSVALAGGVAANHYLRARVSGLRGVKSYAPQIEHCMDNAAMIAYVAGLRASAGEELKPGDTAICRWPVENNILRVV